MTLKTLLASTALLALAGCANQATTASFCNPLVTSPTDTADETETMTADPFESMLPWQADAACVNTTESGLQYVVLKEGPAGGKVPTAKDEVTVNYDGRVPSGDKFDSSYDRGSPSSFGVGQVISGWTEGLQLMKEGDEFMFYIPNALAYGDGARGDVIKAGDDLIFRVELLEVTQPVTADREAWNTYTPWPSDSADVITTDSGLQYVWLERGPDSTDKPSGGRMVAVHYEGRFAENGVTFDSSFQRNQPEVFPANGVIPGWQEMLKLMSKGDRAMVYVPSDLAYGAEGAGPNGEIPPNSDLQFEVLLVDMQPLPQ